MPLGRPPAAPSPSLGTQKEGQAGRGSTAPHFPGSRRSPPRGSSKGGKALADFPNAFYCPCPSRRPLFQSGPAATVPQAPGSSEQQSLPQKSKLFGWMRNVFFFLSFSLFFFFFCISRATPMAHGGSQARSQIRATAASLHHSHSNSGSKPSLQPTPQLMATPDP